MKMQGWLLVVAIFYLTYEQLVKGQSFRGCSTKCGNITVDYPFGTSEGCYYEEDTDFYVTCDKTETGTEMLFYGNIPVINISHSGELRMFFNVSYNCYNGTQLDYLYELPSFSLSTKNKFILVGCNAYAYLTTSGIRDYSTGCISICNSSLTSKRTSNGEGYCSTEASIPQENHLFRTSLGYVGNKTSYDEFNPCAYAFLVENGSFHYDASKDLLNLREDKFPIVVDWSIGNYTCNQVNKTICGENSICYNSTRRKGYLCQCLEGFYGNPYLQDGCQDVDECSSPARHNCSEPSTCENTKGSFICNCPSDYRQDSPYSCTRKDRPEYFRWIVILLGITIGVLAILLGFNCIQNKRKRQRDTELRQQFFEQNGGGMLLQRLSVAGTSNVDVKIFTEAGMKEATNGYDESRILGQGGQGTVYKGIFPDNSIVAIKKARLGDKSQVEQFINEVYLLSKINHRNVVKLLGCCLETEIPLLVYEFINSGTLFEHLHGSMYDASLTWEHRLRIAVEVAETLAYLHSSASIPIIHRDIKTANILLDENLTAKVADFGASRQIPMDKEQLTTLVQGTLGYLDPQYYNTGLLNEKSDVYSFGIVLMELLTRQKAMCFERPQNSKHLVSYFTSAAKENRLHEIVDGQVMNEYNQREIYKAAKVAIECIRVNGEERPRMKEVAAELDALRVNTTKHKWSDQYPEEPENLLGNSNLSTQGDTSTSGYDSIRRVARLDIEAGR